MSIKFFNRNEVLNDTMLDYHADTMQMLDEIRYDPNKPRKTEYELSEWRELYNYLNAIYDGVLYSELEQKSYIEKAIFHCSTFKFHYKIGTSDHIERGKKIALRIYAIIGMINCSDTSSQPMTGHQAMMAIAYKCKTRSGSVTI